MRVGAELCSAPTHFLIYFWHITAKLSRKTATTQQAAESVPEAA